MENKLRQKIALIMLEGESASRYCKHFYMQFKSVLNITHIFTVANQPEPLWVVEAIRRGKGLSFDTFKKKTVKEKDIFLIICFENLDQREYYDRFFYVKGMQWGRDYVDSLYVKKYYIKKLGVDVSGKKIWIFGAGDNGKYFYEAYKDIYPIAGFVSNYEEETECLGLPVIRPSELRREEDIYVVICSINEEVMEEQLFLQGIDRYTQYCLSEMFPKKIFFAIGICQIVQTAYVLNENPVFFALYDAIVSFENINTPFKTADYIRSKGYGALCDVVFFSKANIGTIEGIDYENLIGTYYRNAQKISLPLYYFTAYHMQATDNINPYSVRRSDIRENNEDIWFRGDREINQMVEKGYSADRIIEEISADDFWGEEEIWGHLKRELKRLEVLDRFSSIPIKKFVEENYQKEMLFLDGSHFSLRLLLYLADEVARIIGVSPFREEDAPADMGGKQASVMPIYPCVRKALAMDIEDRWRFYEIQSGELVYLSFEEYERRYIHYAQAVYDILYKTGTFIRDS